MAFLLAIPFLIPLGLFGLHRFYVGKFWTGFAQLFMMAFPLILFLFTFTIVSILTYPFVLNFVLYLSLSIAFNPGILIIYGIIVGLLLLWVLSDLIRIAINKFPDGEGKKLKPWFTK